jgi:hypothetical protein
MNTIKNFVIVLSILLCTTDVSAQYFKAGWTIPLHPTINDSVSIVDSIYTTSPGIVLYSNSILIFNNIITIINCYTDSGSFGFGGYKHDTTGIRYLSEGIYNCTFYSRKIGRSTIYEPLIPCDSVPYIDTFKFTFTVSQYPAGISEIATNTLTIYPNPATDKLTISTSLSDLDVTVFDMSGREFIVPYSQREIDISSLPAGVYCLRLQDTSGSIVRRFVKE